MSASSTAELNERRTDPRQRRYEDKSSNGTNITIQILRIVISGALIVFNESLHLNQIIG